MPRLGHVSTESGLEAVAGATYGADPPGPFGVVLDPSAKATDVLGDRALVAGGRVRPKAIEELVP